MGDIWGDHANHYVGHWLNGRLDGMTTGALVDAILADNGLPRADTTTAGGFLQGFLVDQPGSARDAIESLADLFGLFAIAEAGALTIGGQRSAPTTMLTTDDLVVGGDQPTITTARDPDHDLPNEFVLGFRDVERDHQAATVRAIEPDGRGRRLETLALPAALDPGLAEAAAKDLLRRRWAERNRIGFGVPITGRAQSPGVAMRLSGSAIAGEWLVTEVEEGVARRMSARALDRSPPHAAVASSRNLSVGAPAVAGKPLVAFLDMPFADAEVSAESRLLVAAWAKPWRAQVVLASPGNEGFESRAIVTSPAIVGSLAEPLPPGVAGRVVAGPLIVRLSQGELQSVSRSLLLNGANVAAVDTGGEEWEIVQFETAEEIAPDTWRLANLLRGQAGTTDRMVSGAAAGARFVLLDKAVVSAGLRTNEIGLALNWRIGPESVVDETSFAAETATGGARAGLHFAPVHLRAARRDDGILLSWIRCGRFRADGWDGEDIPLDASAEAYRVEVADAQGGGGWPEPRPWLRNGSGRRWRSPRHSGRARRNSR